ncbi:MAG: DUF4279 domain-containing protein [Myxococcales bacterium]|nr:DUF4279 domain-containing protein [Myxococcales bacterium]
MSREREGAPAVPASGTVHLALVGDRVDPSVASNALGLEASRCFAKGERYQTRDGRQLTRPHGVWRIEFEAADVELAAEALLAVVEPRAAQIRSLAHEMDALVVGGVWWAPDEGAGGFSIKGPTLARLSALCERLDFYFG